MLEHETTAIIQHLTGRAIGSASSFALKDALNADLPKSIKLYLQCEVMRWLRTDLKNENHFSNIPSSTPAVRHLTKLYTRMLAPEYIFTREEFVGTLENAVHFVQNYLCRPQWTLVQFIFENSGRASLADVQTRFEYVSDYGYYGALVQAYMQQKGLQEIGLEEFRSLVSRVDDQIVRQHNPKELALLARPIFEFLLLQPGVKDKTIPLKPLAVFFDDKGMGDLKSHLERICRIRNNDRLTIDQLAEIIEDAQRGPGTNENHGFSIQDIQPALAGHSDPDHDSPPLPAYTEHTGHGKPQGVPGADRRNIALSLTFSGMTAQTVSSPLADLRDSIGADRRERFIRMIFQKDDVYFNVVVETLNAITSWRDASLYLQSFYHTNGIDPFAQEVVEFTDIIQHRYES